jgi:hypothetical protein
MVRQDDWTGLLLLRILHECRMFAHPKLDIKDQKQLITGLFDQVGRDLGCGLFKGFLRSCGETQCWAGTASHPWARRT